MDFWELMPYRLIDWCQRFGGTCWTWNSDTYLSATLHSVTKKTMIL